MKHLEDNFHKQIAQYLNILDNQKYFGKNGFWSYCPFGEKRNAITGALLKAKGTKRGVPDFLILIRKNNITKIIWLEAKIGKNKQSEEQIDFENKTKEQINEKYYIVYNLDNVINIISNGNNENNENNDNFNKI